MTNHPNRTVRYSVVANVRIRKPDGDYVFRAVPLSAGLSRDAAMREMQLAETRAPERARPLPISSTWGVNNNRNRAKVRKADEAAGGEPYVAYYSVERDN